jgi:addiction module RelB/DinJ family antitoxin
MNTTLTIKIDKQTKDASQKLASQLGFTLSSVIKAYLRSFVRTKRMDVSLYEDRPTEYFLEGLKEAEEDIKTGRITSFKDADEMLQHLDKEIANEKQRISAH